jgi:hypothetical protein
VSRGGKKEAEETMLNGMSRDRVFHLLFRMTSTSGKKKQQRYKASHRECMYWEMLFSHTIMMVPRMVLASRHLMMMMILHACMNAHHL